MNTLIYASHFELMEQLTDEQAGNLIKAIGLFRLGKEPKISDPLVMGIWMTIKRDFILQAENYNKKVETNKKNGLKGGRPKTHNNPMGFNETQPNPQNLKEKEKEKEKDIEKDKDNIVDQVKLSREDICADALTSTLQLKNIITHSKSSEEREEKLAEAFDKLFYD
jgi:hypothetical protein